MAGTEKWIYGLPFRAYRANYIDGIFEDDDNFEYIRTDTLGQYIGMKDRNSKEIYEGDILRQWIIDEVEEEGGHWWYAVVEKHNGCYILKEIDFDYSKTCFPEYYIFACNEAPNSEVIGNIFDNPEMLNNETRI